VRTTTTSRDAGVGERLQKVLARAGFGSRRASEELIASGRVRVDGEPARLGQRVDPATARVTVDGVPVVTDTALVHWLLNKPAGHVTTAADPQGRRTVLDLVPDAPRVFPVGRLDRETEGLLLLTNDGELAQLLAHPSHGVEKEYLAEVEGVLAPGAIRRLRSGIDLEDGPTRPARVRVVQEAGDRSSAMIEIVVKEGRKRMVRRMCSAVGHPVRRLVRTRIGPLRDVKLAPGEWRPLTAAEVRELYEAALRTSDAADAPSG
jgi:23S rRNA pseudouridine2605 synthase